MENGVGNALVMPVLLVAVPWLIGKLFSWASDWVRERKYDKHQDALDALNAGVDEAWELVGKPWRKAHPNQSYDGTTKEKLRNVAIDAAQVVLKKKGIDLKKTLGAGAMIFSLIKSIVKARK